MLKWRAWIPSAAGCVRGEEYAAADVPHAESPFRAFLMMNAIADVDLGIVSRCMPSTGKNPNPPAFLVAIRV